MRSLRKSAIRGAVLVLALATAAPAQVGGPPTGPATIWRFLGIPQGIRKVQGATRNRRGNTPNLEPKPPLKALADPANLESPDPSIKKAAEIKQAEDLKKQKIKAVKYLASIGCGCYDIDGGVTDALVASMEDCTEDVRYETVKAITEAARNGCCAKCGNGCCCNKKILEQLAKMAYERDDHGCYLEPSERVREAAIEGIEVCCPTNTSPVIVPAETPAPPQPGREILEAEPGTDSRETVPAVPTPPIPPGEELPAGEGVTGVAPGQPVQLMPGQPGAGSQAGVNDADYGFGVIVHVSLQHELAHVHFNDSNLQPPAGSLLGVYEQVGDKRMLLARLKVVESFVGSANVTGSSDDLAKIARGDVVLTPPARMLASAQASAVQAPVANAAPVQLPAVEVVEDAAQEVEPAEPQAVVFDAPPAEVPTTEASPTETPAIAEVSDASAAPADQSLAFQAVEAAQQPVGVTEQTEQFVATPAPIEEFQASMPAETVQAESAQPIAEIVITSEPADLTPADPIEPMEPVVSVESALAEAFDVPAVTGSQADQTPLKVVAVADVRGSVATASSVTPVKSARRKAMAPAESNRMSAKRIARKPQVSGYVR